VYTNRKSAQAANKAYSYLMRSAVELKSIKDLTVPGNVHPYGGLRHRGKA